MRLWTTQCMSETNTTTEKTELFHFMLMAISTKITLGSLSLAENELYFEAGYN